MAAKQQAAAKKPTAVKKKAAARKPATRKKVTARKASAKPTAAKKTSAKPVARKATEQPLMKALRAEHRHISSVMQLFSDQLEAIEGGELVDTHVVYEIMDYMVTWPDRYHHPREDLIYGRVAEVDAKAVDEVDTLQRDHDQTASRGRKVLKDIERWREGECTGAVVVNSGREYVDHMYEHMNVEEKVVFPHIESVLTAEDWRELTEDDQLRAVSDPVFGPRVQREFRNLARKLRRNVRRNVERGTMVEWIGIEALMESLEVVSMAYDSARGTASDHVRAAVEDSRDLFKESPLKAPMRCTVNNTRAAFKMLEDVAEILKDTLNDLSRVNQERKDRVHLMDQ
jgi:hemerythrin-like domain-containing protein